MCQQCTKTCGSGSRTRAVLCLAGNETAPPTKCGADTIPFAEEKCNTTPCPETEEMQATEAPKDDLIEVCEEVEVEEDIPEGEEDVKEEDKSTAKAESAPEVESSSMLEGSGSGDGEMSGLGATLAGSRPKVFTSEDLMDMMLGDDPAAGSDDILELVRTTEIPPTDAPVEGSGAAPTSSGSGLGIGIIVSGSGSELESSGSEMEEDMEIMSKLDNILPLNTPKPEKKKVHLLHFRLYADLCKFIFQKEDEPVTTPAPKLDSLIESSGDGMEGSGDDSVDPTPVTEPVARKSTVTVLENEKVRADAKKSKPSKDKTPAPVNPIVQAARKRKVKKRICRVEMAPKAGCNTTTFGCCPDRVNSAKGPFGSGKFFQFETAKFDTIINLRHLPTGCPKYETCQDAEFKCCPDGIRPAEGPNEKGCESDLCKTSLFGCCPDGTTPAQGYEEEGCPKPTEPPPPTTPSAMEEEQLIPVDCKLSL